MNQLTAIFLGPQGSGKGTQSALFEAYLKSVDSRHVAHFEMGKSLREFALREGYTSGRVREIMAAGELVPFNISSSVFTTSLADILQGNEHLLIDGFPRSLNQMDVVDATMEFYQRERPVFVHINISDEVGLSRLLKRGRSDDTEANIRNRLAWTRAEWGTIVARINTNPLYTVVEIDGDKSIDEVHADILKAFDLS